MTAARFVLGLLGLAVMSYAVVGATTDDGVDLAGVGAFLAAVLIGHDLIVLPIAIAIGALLTRRLPDWARPWAQSGLAVSAVITVVSIPLLLGVGRIADNPSRLPLNYPRGLLLVLGGVWLAVLGGALRSYHRSRGPRSEQ